MKPGKFKDKFHNMLEKGIEDKNGDGICNREDIEA